MTQSSTQALTTDTNTYDIVVLGGGITGAAIARDAALRGLKVALFEKGDWGSGTSSKSSKLIHGGLRYLEHGEVGLVFESVSERAVQRKVAPHLVRPLPFLVPIYKGAKPGLELMNVGLWIYDTLAMFRAHKMHKTYRGDAARELAELFAYGIGAQEGVRERALSGLAVGVDMALDEPEVRVVVAHVDGDPRSLDGGRRAGAGGGGGSTAP